MHYSADLRPPTFSPRARPLTHTCENAHTLALALSRVCKEKCPGLTHVYKMQLEMGARPNSNEVRPKSGLTGERLTQKGPLGCALPPPPSLPPLPSPPRLASFPGASKLSLPQRPHLVCKKPRPEVSFQGCQCCCSSAFLILRCSVRLLKKAQKFANVGTMVQQSTKAREGQSSNLTLTNL